MSNFIFGPLNTLSRGTWLLTSPAWAEQCPPFSSGGAVFMTKNLDFTAKLQGPEKRWEKKFFVIFFVKI